MGVIPSAVFNFVAFWYLKRGIGKQLGSFGDS
jgi:hypothetical protein